MLKDELSWVSVSSGLKSLQKSMKSQNALRQSEVISNIQSIQVKQKKPQLSGKRSLTSIARGDYLKSEDYIFTEREMIEPSESYFEKVSPSLTP